MPATPEALFAYLDDLSVEYETLQHAPVFTVDEGRDVKAALPGGHTKNLFLKDKADNTVLVSAHAESLLKLNQLHKQLGTRRLSFGSAEQMWDLLGVRPGSVTAFALMNDRAGKVRFLLDKALLGFDRLCFHPLVNTATVAIGQADFARFVAATGHRLEVVDFSMLG